MHTFAGRPSARWNAEMWALYLSGESDVWMSTFVDSRTEQLKESAADRMFCSRLSPVQIAHHS